MKKKILIFHDDCGHQIYPFLNYLLHPYALVYTKTQPSMMFDCIIIDQKLIIGDEFEYLELLKKWSCYPHTTIISVFEKVPSNDPQVIKYATIQLAFEFFVTLGSRIEDIFGTMWGEPIEWPVAPTTIRKSK